MQENLESKYDQYGNMLYRFCLVMLANGADAEDAVQDAFLRYINRKPAFSGPEHEKAWLLRVTANICKDMRRFQLRHPTLNLDEVAEYTQDREQGKILQSVLSLPPKYKLVIHLHYVEGYKVEEIARMMGKSPSAVKMRLNRGREMLRAELGKEGNA